MTYEEIKALQDHMRDLDYDLSGKQAYDLIERLLNILADEFAKARAQR